MASTYTVGNPDYILELDPQKKETE